MLIMDLKMEGSFIPEGVRASTTINREMKATLSQIVQYNGHFWLGTVKMLAVIDIFVIWFRGHICSFSTV